MTKDEEKAWMAAAKERRKEIRSHGGYWLVYMNGHLYERADAGGSGSFAKMLRLCLRLASVFPAEDVSLRVGGRAPGADSDLVAEIKGDRNGLR